MIYRTVDLTDHYSYGMYGRILDISSGGEETTPSPRQIKNMSYARALGIQAQQSTDDLSSCSFAGVEILFLEGPTTYFDQASHPLLAELAARSISRCPDLANSTIVDREGVTLGVAYTPGEHSINLEKPLGSFRSRTTRLVVKYRAMQCLALRLQDSRPPATQNGPKKQRLLHDLYPSLSEVVLLSPWIGFDPDLPPILFALVQDGYKVVVAGFQEQHDDRECVKKGMEVNDPAGYHVKATPDQLVDNLVDMVHKISFREFHALFYDPYFHRPWLMDQDIRREEDFYRWQSCTDVPSDEEDADTETST
jgi:hypothetical protein